MASKDELLSEIQHYKEVVTQYTKLHTEYQDYYVNPMIGISIKSRIFIIFISYFIVGFTSLDDGLKAIILFGLIYLLFIAPKLSVKKRVKKNKTRINELQRLMNEIEEDINPIHIPKTYINYYALTKLESYLINKRADSLKEALNLFEQEKRHDQQMKEINIVQQMQEINLRKSNEAATLGWINLLRR